MKRAPVIPRHTTHTQSTEDTSSPAPAAHGGFINCARGCHGSR